MKTPRQKYENDPEYNRLVTLFESLIHEAKFTPSEIREAALLACINYEMQRSSRPYYMPKEALDALSYLEGFPDKRSRS